MGRRWVGVLLTAAAAAAVSAQAQETPPLQRIVEKPLAIRRPAHACGSEAPWAVMKLGEAAGVLTGAERLPGRCNSVPLAHQEVVQLQGLTVGAALKTIVEIDPRFEWRERKGVIVIRPVEAWTASDNPLNNQVDSFATRKGYFRDALDKFIANVSGQLLSTQPDDEDRVEVLRRQLKVETTKRPAIDALDDIIRTHGAMNWIASYFEKPAGRDSLHVSMFTFDGAGPPFHPRDRQSIPEEAAAALSAFDRIVDRWEVQPFAGSTGMRMAGFHTFDGSYIRSLIPATPR